MNVSARSILVCVSMELTWIPKAVHSRREPPRPRSIHRVGVLSSTTRTGCSRQLSVPNTSEVSDGLGESMIDYDLHPIISVPCRAACPNSKHRVHAMSSMSGGSSDNATELRKRRQGK